MWNRTLFDEQKAIDKILEDGFEKGYATKREMVLLAKHFHWNLGYGKDRTRSALVDFCLTKDKDFNEVRRANGIKDAVRKGVKYRIITAKPIFVTESEIATIKSVRNFEWQKILFAILVYAKERKFTYLESRPENSTGLELWGYYFPNNLLNEIREKIVTAKSNKRTKTSINKLIFVLHEFFLLGLIEPTPSGEKIKLLYADDKSETKIIVDEFEDPVSLYVDYCGGEKVYCEKCGKEIEKKSNRHKMCDDCWREKERERAKQNYIKKNSTV